MADWKVNYQYAVDNVMDPMHGSYLHSASHSMYQGDRQADMSLKMTKTGFVFEKDGQTGVNFDWVEYGQTTPIVENNTRVFFWRCRNVHGWERDTWRFLYRNHLEGLHWDVLEQDRIILEQLAPNAREHEFLYQHDVGITRLRRMFKRAAENQFEAYQAYSDSKANVDVVGATIHSAE